MTVRRDANEPVEYEKTTPDFFSEQEARLLNPSQLSELQSAITKVQAP